MFDFEIGKIYTGTLKLRIHGVMNIVNAEYQGTVDYTTASLLGDVVSQHQDALFQFPDDYPSTLVNSLFHVFELSNGERAVYPGDYLSDDFVMAGNLIRRNLEVISDPGDFEKIKKSLDDLGVSYKVI